MVLPTAPLVTPRVAPDGGGIILRSALFALASALLLFLPLFLSLFLRWGFAALLQWGFEPCGEGVVPTACLGAMTKRRRPMRVA